MKEVVPVITEIAIFILLSTSYIRLCSHRDMSRSGKLLEIISLYSISVGTILGHFKFYVWAVGIAVIGIIKILTTKKEKIGKGSKGFAN